MIMPLFVGARANLWKRTNFEIPNEINTVRVPCRGGPGGEEAHRSDGLGAGTVSKRSLGHGRGVSFLLGNLTVRGPSRIAAVGWVEHSETHHPGSYKVARITELLPTAATSS